ncbi:MAG: glycosyltransferase [Saprospiraceae bacterium]|nr:glycosyltransferase [Saprospiraceae bacterium]
MLSILIPVFRQNIENFVLQIRQAAVFAKVDHEIIIADDGSGPEWKNALNALERIPGIKLIFNEANKGRASIRNQLARESRFNVLLFLDADGELVNHKFIDNYKHYFNHPIVYGGRIYRTNIPVNKNKLLHYTYGIQNESKEASIRNTKPYEFFHSNNFIVSKELILQYPFDESLKHYGYEDLLWIHQFVNKDIEIKHIDNPVIHLGLEDSTIFLLKINDSLNNLVAIEKKYGVKMIRLIRIASRLRSLGLHYVVIILYTVFEKNIRNNLLGSKPSLLLFQFYKLANYYKASSGS